jgi:tetraacyldisaccharide-1-P 4'-kinase
MAVHHIQEQVQGVKAVVMDDALQHRSGWTLE